jgi:hypothetical protein
LNAYELAGAIAPALPDGPWTVDARDAEDSHRYARVARADGAAFYVTLAQGYGTRPARVHVSAALPGRGGRIGGTARDWNAPEPPRISCDPARGAEKIARDVARRFLPGFLETWRAVLAARSQLDREAEDQRAACARIRAAGFIVDEARARILGYPSAFVEAYGRVRIDSGFSIDADAAPPILAAIRRDKDVEAPAEWERGGSDSRGRAWLALFALAYDPADRAASLRDVLADVADAIGAHALDAAAQAAVR